MAIKTRTKYTSKGERDTCNRSILKAIKRGRTEVEKSVILITMWRKGRNPWVTIPNPNPAETNKRLIKVKSNDLWGNPKYINRPQGVQKDNG